MEDKICLDEMMRQEIEMLESEKIELQKECDALHFKLLDAKSKCQGYRQKYEELFAQREKLQRENRSLRLEIVLLSEKNK